MKSAKIHIHSYKKEYRKIMNNHSTGPQKQWKSLLSQLSFPKPNRHSRGASLNCPSTSLLVLMNWLFEENIGKPWSSKQKSCPKWNARYFRSACRIAAKSMPVIDFPAFPTCRSRGVARHAGKVPRYHPSSRWGRADVGKPRHKR